VETEAFNPLNIKKIYRGTSNARPEKEKPKKTALCSSTDPSKPRNKFWESPKLKGGGFLGAGYVKGNKCLVPVGKKNCVIN